MKNSEILIYKSPEGTIKIDVRLEDETVWLTQAQMGELFGKGRTTITEHISNIFKEGELQEAVVCRKFRHTTQHGAIEGKLQEISVNAYNKEIQIKKKRNEDILFIMHRIISRKINVWKNSIQLKSLLIN